MIRYFIIAIVLYLVFLVGYLLWERSVKRRRNAAKKPAFNPFKPAPKEDIIGKSVFVLRKSLPEATPLNNNEKRDENTPTFADGNAKEEVPQTPVAIPASELDRVFTSNVSDESGEFEIDIVIDDEPEGEESEEEDIDTEESEESGEPAGASAATGLGFNELAGMVRTVENPEAATEQELETAGRVLVEVRKTDMFEQVVSGEPKKKVIAGKLMDDFFADYRRRHSEAQPEPEVKAPTDFDVRAFA